MQKEQSYRLAGDIKAASTWRRIANAITWIQSEYLLGERNMLLKYLPALAIIFFTIAAIAKENPSFVITKKASPVIYSTLMPEKVINGATFTASGQTIHLWGIQAPQKQEPFFKESATALELFLDSGELRCKLIDQDVAYADMWHCSVNGADLASLLVKIGFAKDFPMYSKGFYSQEEEVAKVAKVAKLGMWK
jgi:endonuclease YncB( thermonuclease family)